MSFFQKVDPRKQLRFRRPEFQNKLRQARAYERKTDPLPENFQTAFFQSLGLRSAWGRWAALFLILTLAYFTFVSRIFLVKSAQVNSDGLTREDSERVLAQMARKRIFFIPQSHIFLFRRHSFLAETQNLFPEVRQVTDFHIRFPDTVRLGFEMREPRYVWESGEQHYLLDQDGVVFQKISTYDPTSYQETLVLDQAGHDPVLGKPAGDQRIFQFIEQVSKLWAGQVPETGFTSFSLPAIKSQDVFVKTTAGFSVILDLDRSVQVQLANLGYLLRGPIKPETYSGLSYVDLRLATQAYYCYKDAPCAPEYATSTPALIER